MFLLQTYSLAEDLGKAFADLSIMQIFAEAEETIPAGQLKVTAVTSTILCHIYIFRDV